MAVELPTRRLMVELLSRSVEPGNRSVGLAVAIWPISIVSSSSSNLVEGNSLMAGESEIWSGNRSIQFVVADRSILVNWSFSAVSSALKLVDSEHMSISVDSADS